MLCVTKLQLYCKKPFPWKETIGFTPWRFSLWVILFYCKCWSWLVLCGYEFKTAIHSRHTWDIFISGFLIFLKFFRINSISKIIISWGELMVLNRIHFCCYWIIGTRNYLFYMHAWVIKYQVFNFQLNLESTTFSCD